MSKGKQQAEDVHRRLLEQEGENQIHRANIAHLDDHQDARERANLIAEVTETELNFSDETLDNLKAKDFPLANYDDADTVEFKWVQEIIEILNRSRFPHPQSGLQGVARAWATNDRSNQTEALSLNEAIQDETGLLGTFSRATRGEDGMQQETAGKSIKESHAYSDDDGKKGGLRGRLGL